MKKAQNEGEVPTIGVNCARACSEQEKEEEKCLPIIVAKDKETKLIMARVVPSKGLDSYAVEAVEKMVESLGRNKIVVWSDSEQAILA